VTDFNPPLYHHLQHARARYKIFKDHYNTLWSLKEHFEFTVINASGSIKEVEESILQEFTYQSSFELNEDTYDVINVLPVVSLR